jgi:thiamine biosynthesis protein ThiS|tara:strand:+ start:428 stop:628 length:201 start_codon:yes stop_codon:yes gene_type:complete
MRITANSESYDLPEGSTLDSFVRDRSLALERVVVECNGEALTPSEARAAVLKDGDRLEIVRIVAGG